MLDEHDHRVLGRRMRLFHFQEEGPGMVFWHPRGLACLRLLEEQVRRVMEADGFQEVRTPQILARSLWERSGHWTAYREGLFVVPGPPERAAKPVNCPGHIQIFQHLAPSWRDLPLKLGEFGICHRNEPSGSLQGLFRLVQFTQDDGHLFCLEPQVVPEVAEFAGSLFRFYRRAGFREVRVALATRPPERAGDDGVWDRAEAMLAAAATQAGLAFEIHPGEGAFYGPKLEFTLQDHRGRAWQCGTIQLDMVLPERFDLQVSGPGGEPLRPVMLHRAMLGSLERFLGILLEHHQGRLPPWLAPEQVLLAPVEARHEPFAVQVAGRFRQAGLRVRVAPAAHGLGRRVKEARELGIPWFLAVGDQEQAGGPFRFRPLRGPAVQRSQAEALDWLAADGGA
jgi:threonyl-tRNA synthetase